jgi:hypothetical protein
VGLAALCSRLTPGSLVASAVNTYGVMHDAGVLTGVNGVHLIRGMINYCAYDTLRTTWTARGARAATSDDASYTNHMRNVVRIAEFKKL